MTTSSNPPAGLGASAAVEILPRGDAAGATVGSSVPRLKRPIFISGLRKSGTSMTKALFDNHPDLFVFPVNEMHFFRFTDHPSVVKDKKAREPDLEKLKHLVANQKFIRNQGKRQAEILPLDEFDRLIDEAKVTHPADIISLILRSMATVARTWDGDVDNVRYVAKSVLETEYVPDLVKWFPDMKFIYVMRNPYGHFNAIRWSMRSRGSVSPRDKKFSAIKHPYPYLGKEINRMKLSYYFMRRYRELYPDNFYVMVYDRLVQDPEPEMRKMCEFLDLEYNEDLLRTSNAGRDQQRSGWTTDGDRPDSSIDPSPATKWKEQIKPLEIRLINTYFRDVLEEFGFEMLPSKASRLMPFGLSERPGTYVLNRMLFAHEVVRVWH